MEFENYLQKKAMDLPDKTVIGIDIGSRQSKAVLLHDKKIYTAIIFTGYFMQQNAEELLEQLFLESGISKNDVDYIVVTGYGRISLHFDFAPCRTVTEIACHGMGAHYLVEGVQTIIDIGGQDSKVIRINPEDGSVVEFAMNDKCAAGTGRFLEKMANVLGYEVAEIGDVSLEADKIVPVNSTCVVFAESEVISTRAKGETAANLAAGIHASVARRVHGLLHKVGIIPEVLFTGGVSNNSGMRKAFEDLLGFPIQQSRLDTVFAGALGAAVFAADYAVKGLKSSEQPTDEKIAPMNLNSLKRAMSNHLEKFIHHSEGKKAYVGYICSYVPLEILSAANVSYIRLMNRGTPEEVIAGEGITQSMQCDFHKSILGSFIKKRPEYMAIQRIYSFHVCSCMRKTMEAVNDNFVRTDIFNLAKNCNSEDSKKYLSREIQAFKENLEELTGERIREEAIIARTNQYNQAKAVIRQIAQFRKKQVPMLSSEEFLQIIEAYYSLPIDELLPELQKILAELKAKKEDTKGNHLKLMLSGGIIASGDNKNIQIMEELGADIVVEDNCTGIKPLYTDVNLKTEDSIFTQIAAAYLGKAPCASMFHTREMISNAVNLAKEYEVDGVVLYYLKFCSCFSLLEKLYEEEFEKADIPLFILPGDYATGDEGQLKTRLEAFMEMLQTRKDSLETGKVCVNE